MIGDDSRSYRAVSSVMDRGMLTSLGVRVVQMPAQELHHLSRRWLGVSLGSQDDRSGPLEALRAQHAEEAVPVEPGGAESRRPAARVVQVDVRCLASRRADAVLN